MLTQYRLSIIYFMFVNIAAALSDYQHDTICQENGQILSFCKHAQLYGATTKKWLHTITITYILALMKYSFKNLSLQQHRKDSTKLWYWIHFDRKATSYVLKNCGVLSLWAIPIYVVFDLYTTASLKCKSYWAITN